MRRIIFGLTTLVAASSLLGGCGFVHRHFGKKDVDYKSAVQEHPLEVPPDLDSPAGSGALVVPAASAQAASASSAPVSSSPASSAALDAAPTSVPASTGSGASIGGDGLSVADSVESTWSRVGLALERSGAATILSRDGASRTYTVQTTGQATSKPGWFKRVITLGHAGGTTTAQVQLTVRVVADGTSSKVAVEGATDEASQNAARALLATLQQRLT